MSGTKGDMTNLLELTGSKEEWRKQEGDFFSYSRILNIGDGGGDDYGSVLWDFENPLMTWEELHTLTGNWEEPGDT